VNGPASLIYMLYLSMYFHLLFQCFYCDFLWKLLVNFNNKEGLLSEDLKNNAFVSV